MKYLQSLTQYKRWANDLLYDSLKDLAQEELTTPRPIVFGSLIRTLNHTYAMDLVWQAHLQNKSHKFDTRNPEECPSLCKLAEEQRILDEWYISYGADLSESEEDEIVDFTFIGGGAGSMSRRDMILHVVNHGTYHRGNVTGMMYDCSMIPPTTDYSVFLRQLALNKSSQQDASKSGTSA